MTDLMMLDSRRCTYFFLYDGSKVRGEGDPTRDGICYFYPEETPLDKQELLCGQLAGVGRCVSELSSSPVRVLRLRHSKFAVRMEDDFFWALGSSVDVPTVSVCELLDQLINLYCFYNGPVRQSYQENSRDILAARWAQYLCYLQAGSTELHNIFSCLRTVDSTQIDPLLLLKAALILQACQRCPLVLAGCILFHGRVVSSQMPPDLTVKVMAHETEAHIKDGRSNGVGSSKSPGSAATSRAVTSTTVHLTLSELQGLRSSVADTESRSQSTPSKGGRPPRARLSRTLSDTPSTESKGSLETDSSHASLERPVFSPGPEQRPTDDSPPFQNRRGSPEAPPVPNGSAPQSTDEGAEEGADEDADTLEKSRYSCLSNGAGARPDLGGDGSPPDEASAPDDDEPPATASVDGCSDPGRPASGQEGSRDRRAASDSSGDGDCAVLSDGRRGEEEVRPCAHLDDALLFPMTLYRHRVKGLVLVLLVETHLQSDTAAMEEVYNSSLASLNGLEAHLRAVPSGAPGPQGPFIFAHFDCIQNTLTTNLSGRSGGGQERSFVRAASLLHSHFCNSEALQEAIIRSARMAMYGTRSVAHETYFLQHGGSVRNSGVPNHQDTAFSLPSKARHRLLKHGVNLL